MTFMNSVTKYHQTSHCPLNHDFHELSHQVTENLSPLHHDFYKLSIKVSPNLFFSYSWWLLWTQSPSVSKNLSFSSSPWLSWTQSPSVSKHIILLFTMTWMVSVTKYHQASHSPLHHDFNELSPQVSSNLLFFSSPCLLGTQSQSIIKPLILLFRMNKVSLIVKCHQTSYSPFYNVFHELSHQA